jgi:molecular chaperone GrpE (heat shock protein)
MEAKPVNNDGDNHNDGDGPNATDSKREPNVEIPTHEQEIVRLRDECAQLEQQLQRQLALDTFSMALAAFDQGTTDPKMLIEGVRMTRMLLTSALERHGLQEIRAEGLPFDPQRHEAVSTEAAPGVPDGHVVRVLQAGYLLGDRVVRYSRVVVAGQTPKP